jgi:hypothetical protein
MIVNATQQRMTTMRKIAEAIFSIFWQLEDEHPPKIVTNYHEHYKQIDQQLLAMPEVLKLVHDDIAVPRTTFITRPIRVCSGTSIA